MSILFFIYFLPLILGLYLSEKKRRSTWKAIVVCLFLGWIAVILICFLEAKKECPFCAQKIPQKAIVCHACRHDLPKTQRILTTV